MSQRQTLEDWQKPKVLEARFRPFYRDDLEFHNWPHALAVRAEARANAKRCVDHGLSIDMDLIDPPSLGHDAGFWLTPRGVPGSKSAHRFTSKERFSGAITRQELTALGMPRAKVLHAGRIVESTEKGVACRSLEARCVRQADLANVASRNPVVFLNSTYRLYRESKRLQGEAAIQPTASPHRFMSDFIGFAAVSYEVLSTYNDEDVSLGDFDRNQDGISFFAERAARNIGLLVPDQLTDFLSKHLLEVVTHRPIGV